MAPDLPTSPHRRDLLGRGLGVAGLLAGLGLLPPSAQAAWSAAATAGFGARTAADAIKALGLAAPADSTEVTLAAPDVAENGASVSITGACSAAGVQRLLILVEKNPSPLCAVFDLSASVEPSITTRVKMADSSDALVVAVLADGRVLYARRSILVTQGGCGG